MTAPIDVPLVYIVETHVLMKAMDRIGTPVNTVVRTFVYLHVVP